MGVLAYFITFHAYGSWLHGRDKGSVDDKHNKPGTPFLAPNSNREEWAQVRLKRPPVELDAQRRFVVDKTIRQVCDYRKWFLHAVNVRTTHAHVVVTAGHHPDRVMNDLKGYCTRRMREAIVCPRDLEPWSYHGSTRWLDTPESFAGAVDYVLNQQGVPLPMVEPAGWSRVVRHEPRA